jgi:hypothetical protein
LLAFKYALAEMRRHASIQGYVITEFTDRIGAHLATHPVAAVM